MNFIPVGQVSLCVLASFWRAELDCVFWVIFSTVRCMHFKQYIELFKFQISKYIFINPIPIYRR